MATTSDGSSNSNLAVWSISVCFALILEYSADERIIRRELEEQIGIKYYKIRVEKKDMDKGSLLPLMAFWLIIKK